MSVYESHENEINGGHTTQSDACQSVNKHVSLSADDTLMMLQYNNSWLPALPLNLLKFLQPQIKRIGQQIFEASKTVT